MITSNFVIILLFLCLPFLVLSQLTDRINPTSSLTDPQTIESSGRVFRFGFFSPPNSIHRYLGVFYVVSEETVIWIANRDRPLNDSSGRVTIAGDGNLVLMNGRNQTIWSTNATGNLIRNTSAQIRDTGNLVLIDSSGSIIWEAFTHPTDVYMPTMDIIHNVDASLRSWRSGSDPGVGNYTANVQHLNIPQVFIWNNGRPRWRSGQWNGRILIGVQELYTPYFRRGVYLMRITLNTTGSLVQTVWSDQERRWDIAWEAPQYECDVYGTCGPFGSCNTQDSPICSCLRGFEPMNRAEWDSGNWTSGCRRRSQLQCSQNNSAGGDRDGFLRLPYTKVPDFAFQLNQTGECRTICMNNCSCIAYANDSSIGCMFWSETLVDIQRFTTAAGIDFFVRLPSSELDNRRDRSLYIIIPVVVGFVAICITVFITWCLMAKRKGKKAKNRKVLEARQKFSSDSTAFVLKDEAEKVNIEELPLFTFETLAKATDQFNEKNLLGRGGFGHVYKGILENGKEIAVKRLSAASGQGDKEFTNEVVVISKLQHRNLVRLFGCCVEREEKMLIYEYMPNNSLDGCLFDPTHPSRKILDWKKRFSIIGGIGKGLLYLHRDSRLKIIHRDLKPSNVLLDEDWNPKISDFGMARIFGGNEDHGNTARIVGTYGYMAPEYAMEGRFSEKSDVYSFGVLMLEILSGKKNTRYYNQEWSLSLLGCAWKLWSEDNGLALVDQTTANSDFQEDIVRCIHIALLCVQEFPNDRPAIQTVLSMLSCEIVDLPKPEQPVFAENWDRSQVGTTQVTSQLGFSVNELTITQLDGR